MTNANIFLNIGDKIGFTIQAQDIDDNDKVIYLTVVELTTRDGEPAYYCAYPDGEVSRSAIRQSALVAYHVQLQPRNEPAGLICLSSRKAEFKQALRRGLEDNIEVYPGGARDLFDVVNRTKGTEYRVRLETSEGKVNARCDCKDFTFRKHICKHIAEALQETCFGTIQVVVNA